MYMKLISACVKSKLINLSSFFIVFMFADLTTVRFYWFTMFAKKPIMSQNENVKPILPSQEKNLSQFRVSIVSSSVFSRNDSLLCLTHLLIFSTEEF